MPDFGQFRGFSDKLFEGQLPTELGLIGSEDFGFDSDAQAFFDQVDTAGGTLSDTEKSAVNQLVLDMKDDGIWSKMKAIYPMVGASAAACAQNLKSSSFTGTFNGGWTFASTGATPNGSNGYVSTSIKPSDMNQNSIHFGVYTNNDATEYKIGVNKSASITVNSCWLRGNNTVDDMACNSNYTPDIQQDSQGFVLVNRIASNQDMVFNNNTKSFRSSTSNTPINDLDFYFGALNSDGSSSNHTTAEFKFTTIGDGLTDTEASDFYTAVQAFQTTLSREV